MPKGEGLDLKKKALYIILAVAIGVALYLLSQSNYVLFHTIIEFFSVIIGVLIFTISIISKKFNKSSFLVTLGPGILTVSLLTFLHAITYKGMGLIQGYDANLPTQLWIALNFILGIAFLIAIWYSNKNTNYNLLLVIYLLLGIFATLFCMFRIFPVCYIEGTGLTLFKRISEYIIILIFIACIVLFFKKKKSFDSTIFIRMIMSLVLFVIAEFMFTLYSDVYGIQNFIGHYFRFIAFLMVFISVAIEGIQKPYNTIFADLYDMSNKDGLTHLYNSRFFVEALEKYIETALSSGKPLYLMMFDLDNFKEINDTHGHLTGDDVLIETAKIIKSNLRNSDIASRQGGDEFSAILYDVEEENVKHISSRIQEALKPSVLTDKEIKISLSGGIVKYSEGDSQDLIRRADQLLYKAKENGRDMIFFEDINP